MSSLISLLCEVIFKLFVVLWLLLPIQEVLAGGFSAAATPTRIDIVRGGGLMLYGAFGNPSSCIIGDKLYVKAEHPQYDKIYAMVLMAYASGKKVFGYSHSCEPVSWYSTAENTFNIVQPYAAFNITD